MDSETSTENFQMEIKAIQENVLLEIIKEMCGECNLSKQLRGKICRIIADCDLTHHSSLHRLSTHTDENTSTLLGLMHKTSVELTYEEQREFNEAILLKIETKVPELIKQLDNLKESQKAKQSNKSQIEELQKSISEKLDVLEEQEKEKMDLMMEWLNFKINEVNKFSNDSSELLNLKTRIFDLKSKITHLQMLQTIFTETTQSIKAYTEIRNDLQHTIKETEQRIKEYKGVVKSD